MSIRPGSERLFSLIDISLRLQGAAEHLQVNPYLVSCTYENYRIVLFKDGRALIHGTNQAAVARAVYDRLLG
ncbi:hypothetical protein [Peribacillus deserti]|uniref:hypothetical protein n=1 Tax=Peribacillus deserti TaxID=673318 RepID=UPI00115BF5A4|nr:hypothetical protein [Peribacillus deserti]